jgi:hypothetical protein
MGDQALEPGPAQVQLAEKKASYAVIAYLGKDLPETYRNMILAKWLRTLRFGNDFFRLIESNAYFETYQKYIKAIIGRPQCVVRLAVLSDAPDVCLGFSVSEPDTLHYVWCHKDNRKIGVASALMQFPFSVITHLTSAGMGIWHKKFPAAKFNPFK